MGLSRTDFVPVLAIVAGGVIGASLSFGLLALAPSGDLPVDPFGAPYEYVRYEEDQGVRSDDAAVPESVVNAYENVEIAEVLLPQEQTLRFFTFLRGGERIEVNGMVITPGVRAMLARPRD